MSAVRVPTELRIVAPRRSVRTHVREIWEYRELLAGLTRKELKVRYKNSALGFVWSMVQPLFLMGVYTAVFSILGAGFKDFTVWLLCGLLMWTFISTSLQTSVQAVTANSYLVTKVRFPRAVLPLASVCAAAVHFGLQIVTFAGVLLVLRHRIDLDYVWLLPVAIVAAIVVCAAFALVLAAVNVYARDTQHLLDLVVLGWFWMTPIIYQYARMAGWLSRHGIPAGFALVNPFTPIVITFQRAIYGVASIGPNALLPDEGPLWYLRNLGIVTAVAVALVIVALRVFDRAETNFAEAL